MSATLPSSLQSRDAAEIGRSREEARQTQLSPAEINRYLNPPANTAYGLEYAFYLVGDVRGKTVLDIGCGTGEELVPLIHKGAHVIGIDISPELIELAKRRVQMQCTGFPEPELMACSAYETGLEDASVDLVLSSALLHHLDLPTVLREIRRILKPGGKFVVREPVRFSRAIATLRKLLPQHKDVSEFEHPLTVEEYSVLSQYFTLREERAFRLPIVPIGSTILPHPLRPKVYTTDRWLLKNFPSLWKYAGARVALFS
jgi:SAM-dependent methyltransferase